jgi:hypothetical protein
MFFTAGAFFCSVELSMPDFSLRIREREWDQLRKLCASSFRGRRDTEAGAIGVLGKRTVGGVLSQLIVAEILWPGPGDVIAESRRALTFSAGYLRRAHMLVRKHGLHGIITFHTHPLSDLDVSFSPYDDEQDPLLIENLQELWPNTMLTSVVLGMGSQKGRLWISPTDQVEIETLASIGEQIRYLPLNGKPAKAPPSSSEIFDRARAITGSGALAELRKRTAAVVGASGTGSLVCELLIRAGIKRLLIIDPDIIKLVNLNRILYATIEDAQKLRYKAEVLQERLAASNLGCEVVAVVGSILDNKVLERLNEADFVFGCVDRDYPRMLLSKYSYQYTIPYVDVGSEIGGDAEGIVSTDARVNYVAPGRWCLRCTGLVNSRRLAFESLTAKERRRKVALGYSDDLLMTQPAVMELNMRSASAGVLFLRHLLQPFLRKPLPTTFAENLVTYNMKAITSARAGDESCDICRVNPVAGFGDCGDAIGLPSEIAAALMEPSAPENLDTEQLTADGNSYS